LFLISKIRHLQFNLNTTFDMKFNSKVIHAGLHHDKETGAVMTPIYQTSTYAQSEPGKHSGYEYARTQNPTRDALQKQLAQLENGKHGICFASGMGAIDALAKLLKPGDEVISTNDLYGGTYRIFTKIFEPYGIKFQFVDLQNLDEVKSKINDNTKMIWVETPTNPMINIIDIEGISDFTKNNDILLVVDNTFATPYLQLPLDLGADVVTHSATKYLGGHSDVVHGCIIVKDDNLKDKLEFIQNSCGAVPGPQDCFLVLRGLKTLAVRMQRHCENARQIAEYLTNHPKVAEVNYPGLKSHAGHNLALRQMKDFGGMLSFTLKDDSLQAAVEVMKKVKFFTLAESLGGVESLIGHPASMTHASIPKEEREKTGVYDSLIRLSVGIEDLEDLKDDLNNALS